MAVTAEDERGFDADRLGFDLFKAARSYRAIRGHVNAGAKLGQRPGVKVGHLRFEHDKARKPLREGAFVLLRLV